MKGYEKDVNMAFSDYLKNSNIKKTSKNLFNFKEIDNKGHPIKY